MGRVVMNQNYGEEFAREFGPAWQRDTAPKIAAALVTTMPIDTGEMVLGVEMEEFVDAEGRPSIRARGTAKHTGWVDQGTGLFGPLGKYITPKAGKEFLKWTSRETGRPVYARRTRGQPGQHFFRRALEMVFDRVTEYPFGRGGG